MVKKAGIMLVIIFIILIFGTVFAVEEIEYSDRNVTQELIEQRERTRTRIDEFEARYGSRAYGTTAFVLEQIRWFSLPICFLGMAAGAIFHFALGTRRLDMKQRGQRMLYAFGTLLVIAQVLPLLFALVVRGWIT